MGRGGRLRGEGGGKGSKVGRGVRLREERYVGRGGRWKESEVEGREVWEGSEVEGREVWEGE